LQNHHNGQRVASAAIKERWQSGEWCKEAPTKGVIWIFCCMSIL